MGISELKIDARRKKILEILNRCGRVQVSQLSSELGATAVTIRSDLDALESGGMLERVTGGAIAKTRFAPNEMEIPFLLEKQAIAAAAAGVIQDGDTLFLNSGTTTLQIACALKQHRKLNIVTSSIAIATELSDIPSFRVILLGGELNVQYGFTHGGDAQEQLTKYQADHVFLSVDGVSKEEGITTYHADEALLDRMMAERAQDVIVTADHSKIGRAGFSLICPLAHVHTLITDTKCGTEALAALRNGALRILEAE